MLILMIIYIYIGKLFKKFIFMLKYEY